MLFFWVLAGLLLLGAVAVIAPALRKPHCAVATPRSELTVGAARRRLRELEAERDSGLLTGGEFERQRRDLESALLADLDNGSDDSTTTGTGGRRAPRLPIVLAMITVPAIAVGLYLQVGTPQALQPASVQPGGEQANTTAAAMVTTLRSHLAQNPADQAGWQQLGRAYMALGDYPAAVRAYARLRDLAPTDDEVAVQYAGALALSAGGFEGEPQNLIDQVLERQPDNAPALWMAGIAARARGEFKQALLYWHRLQSQRPGDASLATQLDGLIAETETALAQSNTIAQQAAVKVKVQVTLAPALAARAKPDDTVFIYARAVNGPPMPLAVVRREVRDLPVTVTLDDTMAMQPGMNLSKFPDLLIGARVALSGTPTAQSGDLQGETPALHLTDAAAAKITIDQVVP